ncbi:MAG TPA: hypothetical protein VFA03_15760 [Acetobacteraceae bacterium]|nr:hypothetical protein [Acetobacteraceae bacterium]
MRIVTLAALCAVAFTLNGCVSAEDQRLADQQACMNYGFRPGTDAFANCMMNTAQQRAAQQAAAQRQQSINDEIARQAQANRDAADRQAQAAQDAANAARVQQMMGTRSTDSMGIPKVEPLKIDTPSLPDMSGMHCTGTSIANAGSMSCSN